MKLWSTKALLLPWLQSATEQIGLSQPRLPLRECVWTDKDVRGVPALISPRCASLFLLLHSVRRYGGVVDSSFISDSSHKLDLRAPRVRERPTAGPEWDVGAQKTSAAAATAKYANVSILYYFDPAQKVSESTFLELEYSVINFTFHTLLAYSLQELPKTRLSAGNP